MRANVTALAAVASVAVWVAIGAGAGVAVILGLVGAPPALLGAIVGGTVGAVFVALTTYWIVARVPSGVVLVSSKKTYVSVVAVADRYPAPLNVTRSGTGLLTDSVAFGGRTFRLARQFRERFDTIVSGELAQD